MTGERAVVAGLVVMMAACARGAPPSVLAESAPALVSPGPSSAEPRVLAVPDAPLDTSLTWPTYRAAGVPEIDRAWSVEDYRQGVQVFGKMAASSRTELPRRDSERSGGVFGRLVSLDNFARVAASGAAEARARLGEEYLAVFPGLLQLYSPASDAVDFAVEQGELIVALLELLKLSLHASRTHTASEAAWGERYERQKAMTVGVLHGVRAMLLEEKRYTAELRQRLKGDAARLGPELVSHLDIEQRQQFDDIVVR